MCGDDEFIPNSLDSGKEVSITKSQPLGDLLLM